MVDVKEAAAQTSLEAASKDRRRPGRMDNVSPALIPLLRQNSNPADSSCLEGQDELLLDSGDDLGPARGVVVGAALSLPLWAFIIYAGHWMLS